MRLSSTFLSLARSSFFLEVRVFETRVRFKKTFDAGVERLPRDPQRLRQSLDRVRFRVEPAPGDFFDGRFHCLGLLRVFDKLSSLLTHVDAFYKRFSVDHDIEFVSGDAHTNNLECYWSLLKRSLRGTYVAVDPWHLYRYCEEQQFRFNFRKLTDGQRFEVVAQQVTGRRLTYRELTGKEYLPIQ